MITTLTPFANSCARCNMGISFVDNPAWIAKAIAYREQRKVAQ